MRWTIVLVLMSTGCVSVSSSVLNSAYTTDPVQPEEVTVYLDQDVVPDDCDRVAIVYGSGWDVLDHIRAEAGRLGANAIDLRPLRSTPVVRESPGDQWDALALRCG